MHIAVPFADAPAMLTPEKRGVHMFQNANNKPACVSPSPIS
jgi:hypothetical protein